MLYLITDKKAFWNIHWPLFHSILGQVILIFLMALAKRGGKVNFTLLWWIPVSAYLLAERGADCHWSTDRSSAAGHNISAPPQNQSSHPSCLCDPGRSISDRLLWDQPPLWHRGQCSLAGTSSGPESPCVTKILVMCDFKGANILHALLVLLRILTVNLMVQYSLKRGAKAFNHSRLCWEYFAVFTSQVLNFTLLWAEHWRIASEDKLNPHT